MLMDIVKNIVVSQDDFDLVGEIIGPAGLRQAATDVQADVIVLGALAATETKDLQDLLYGRPRMKIIVIAADGRNAILHELQPRLIQLGEVAPISLIAAIRGTPESDGAPSMTRQ
jgi:hypothetical protein